MRRSYPINIRINRSIYSEIIIDPHFELKHSESMDDEIILALVQNLDGRELEPISTDKDGFDYFKTEPMHYKGKPYRLVWLIDPDKTYIGVLNCFRRTKNEKED